MLKKGKVLVTGMSGFIATVFLQHLARKYPDINVWGFDLEYGQDLRNFDQVEQAVEGKDLVINFGALTHIETSIKDPRPFLDSNVIGCFNVLEACRKHKVKLIQISSSEVYGTGKYFPQDELHPLYGHSPYAWTKICQDRACYSWWQTYELDVRVVRLFNQYGPYQDVRKVIPKFMYQIEQGKPCTVYGDGLSERDWVYVFDSVEAIWGAQDIRAGEAVNVATGKSYSVLQLIQILKGVMGKGKDSKIIFVKHTDERFGHVKKLQGSAEKIEAMTGWKPKTDLAAGLAALWQWLQVNKAMLYTGGEKKALVST